MSRQLIARSPDLEKLRSDGFDIEVRLGYLLVKEVPYVNSNKVVTRGVLISKLELANDATVPPQDHVAYWNGEHPCHSDGRQISAIHNPSPPQDFGSGILADHTFSAKASYRNYHHKMTAYIARITGEARVLDPSVRAETFPLYLPEDPRSVFKYEDTASSRAHLGSFNQNWLISTLELSVWVARDLMFWTSWLKRSLKKYIFLMEIYFFNTTLSEHRVRPAAKR